MSIAEEVEFISAPSAPGLAEWQSEDDRCSQQDRSHAKTDTESEIKSSDKSTGKSATIFRIG